ncbi:MAG: agmatine deiminase family protein [Planctomycetaceae bacterium]|nr:agmatine deiminase family protein [Planctomycetaceae bacterium]
MSTGFTPPAALGYRMPAEWERHAATWLSWPHNRDTWPGRFDPIPDVWRRLVEALAPQETVHVLASGEAREQAVAMVGAIENVIVHDVPTNDAWIRDHGPTFLVGPDGLEPALVDWEYNAWGGKYPPFDADNAVPGRIAEITGRRVFRPGIVMEGGAIDTNGEGLFLAARSCLTDPNRNPDTDTATIERYLADYLGAKRTIWIDGTMAGDDTDGHVDQLARFVGPSTVVVPIERDPGDANYASLAATAAQLRGETDLAGRPLQVVELPMPRPVYFDETRAPACYANFYLANGLVLVPQYGDPADAEALEILAGLFPDRQAVGLPARDLVWGLGAFHCATQQEPG